VAFTKHAGHGIELAEQAAFDGRNFIIACGGDGTINEVANGILLSGEDVELGVLPSGTGGDFRRTLGMPSANRDAAAALRDGKTSRIDVGRVSFIGMDGESVERYFLNVSSFGLAASVIKRVKTAKVFDWLPAEVLRGKANFAVSTLQEVLDMGPVNIRVRIDDGEEKMLRTVNFCVANARYFGGGMMIAPDAKINDGLLDIVNIGDLSTARIMLRGYTLYRGTHNSLPEVNSMTAKKIEVSASDDLTEIRLETDGELPGRLPATYEVVPAALRVRVPCR
jgi:diacylglycerol kinase (ATP)